MFTLGTNFVTSLRNHILLFTVDYISMQNCILYPIKKIISVVPREASIF